MRWFLTRVTALAVVVSSSWLVTVAVSPAPAVTSDTMIPAAGLHRDVAILRRAYETLHPGLLRYNTRAQMDAAFTALDASFDRDRTLADTYLALSLFTAQIRCGHTYANFFNQPDATAAALFGGQTRLPFLFRWLAGEMVVTRDLSSEGRLPRGTRILALNGIPAPMILRELERFVRADGGNDAKRIASLNVAGREAYEAFDVFYPLRFPQPSPAYVAVVRTPASTHETSVAIAALTAAQRRTALGQLTQKATPGEPLFSWMYLSNGAAYLNMPSWVVYNSTWDWTHWLNERLDDAAARNAPALIVDLRGNEGGDDVGAAVLAHFARRPVASPQYARLVRYRRVPKDLGPYLSTYDSTLNDWGDRAVTLTQPWITAPAGETYFALRSSDRNETPVPARDGKKFTGHLYVLVDGANSSATFGFVQTVRAENLGTLVGEPTGGNLRGINGGGFFFLTLPNSHIELDVPLIGTFPPAPMDDATLEPDIAIRATADDIADGRDPVLQWVDAAIRRARSTDAAKLTQKPRPAGKLAQEFQR